MQLIPIQTRRIAPGEDLVSALTEAQKQELQSEDILVISSKAVATSEGRVIELQSLEVSDEAKRFAKKCGREESFCQAVLTETAKRNGKVVGTCPGALLTELKPWDVSCFDRAQHDTMGVILTANAGLDESNAPEGCAIGWPEDPVKSVMRLRQKIGERMAVSSELLAMSQPKAQSSQPIAVIISDSCCRPRRWGVTAYALAVAGINPLQDQKGVQDLYGRSLRITQEAIADQLATAANALMGNADRGCPAVVIRNHKIPLNDYVGWVPGINPAEDLFAGLL